MSKYPFCFYLSLLQVFKMPIVIISLSLLSFSLLSLSLFHLVCQRHVSMCLLGQQAGAVGIDEGVAMGTEGWDVSGGRAGA